MKRGSPYRETCGMTHISKRPQSVEKEKGPSEPCHNLNTIISGGFACDRVSSSSKKKYARHVMHISSVPLIESMSLFVTVSFSQRDAKGIIPHEDDQMVINLQIHDRSVNKVLTYQTV